VSCVNPLQSLRKEAIADGEEKDVF
jgi:hypothetical protein